ncbi:MAG TPA: hypothetical protein VMZ03_02525 [Chitinophagaceae bacterium]|nr:hypothetical protein [Chitinophagaceae bacterium]
MEIPLQLLESLKSVESFDKKTFEELHNSGEQVTSIRLNPAKPSKIENLRSKIPWSETGYYLEVRPSFTFDPLFHAGCYYVQDASSMFLEQALKQTADLSKPLKVLDLCAAPGGKSTHIQSLISKESLLVSNEVIRSRANILKDNIIKWGCENVAITNNDPKDFSKLENYFDVIVVDAPCSGSGLFRKEPEAIEEWSQNNVQLCSQRQQRILADVYPALKKDGILIYSTCSYSQEEDEKIADWLLSEFPFAYCPLSIQPEWGVVDTGNGYRFWPDKLKGEGFFLACFKKRDGETGSLVKSRKVHGTLTKKEIELTGKWMSSEGKSFVKHIDTVYTWPEQLANDLSFLLENCKVLYSGTLAGEIMRDKLIPDHALAMSRLVLSSIGRIELDNEQTIQYLQRRNIELEGKTTGWQLVTYRDHPLGWVNVLPNRVNNYYPKELRILKDK